MQQRLRFSTSSTSATRTPGGLLAGLLRLVFALASMAAAAAMLLLVAMLVATLGGFSLLRRAWLTLRGRPHTPWLLPLVLRLLARTRFGGVAARYRAAQPAAGRGAGAADVTDVVARPVRPD